MFVCSWVGEVPWSGIQAVYLRCQTWMRVDSILSPAFRPAFLPIPHINQHSVSDLQTKIYDPHPLMDTTRADNIHAIALLSISSTQS